MLTCQSCGWINYNPNGKDSLCDACEKPLYHKFVPEAPETIALVEDDREDIDLGQHRLNPRAKEPAKQ